MESALLRAADEVLAEVVEGVATRNHQNRLARLGQRERILPPADGELCARGHAQLGDALEVLVDGENVLLAKTSYGTRRLLGALEGIVVDGWTEGRLFQ